MSAGAQLSAWDIAFRLGKHYLVYLYSMGSGVSRERRARIFIVNVWIYSTITYAQLRAKQQRYIRYYYEYINQSLLIQPAPHHASRLR